MAATPVVDARQPRSTTLAPVVMELDDIRLADSTPRASIPPHGALAELESRLNVEQAARATAEARLHGIQQELLAARAAAAAAVTTTTESPDVESLRGELAHRKLEITNLLRRMADAESAFDIERQRLTDGARHAAGAQLDELTRQVQALTTQLGDANLALQRSTSEIERIRGREADTQRALSDEKSQRNAAEQSLAALQAQFGDLTIRLHTLVAQVQDEQRKTEAATAEARNLHAMLTRATDDNTALRKHIDERDTLLKDAHAAADAEQDRAMQTDLELSELTEQHDEAIRALQKQLDDVSAQLARASSALTESNARADSSAAHAAQLEERLAAALARHASDDARIKQLEEQSMQGDLEANELREEHEEAITALRRQLEEKSAEGDRKDAALDAADRRAQSLEARVKESEEQLMQADIEANELKEQLDAAEKRASSAAAALQASVDEKSAALGRVEKEAGVLREQLNARVVKIGMLESGLEDAQKELTREKSERAALEQQLAQATDCADELRQKADGLEKRVTELEASLADSETWRAREKKRADDREKDVRSLASDVTRAEERAQKLESLLESERKRAEGIRSQLEQEKARLDENSARLRTQLDGERKRADAATREHERLHDDQAALERRLQETRDALETLRAKETAARERIAALEADVTSKDALTARLEALLEQAAEQAAAAFEKEQKLTEERDELLEHIKSRRKS